MDTDGEIEWVADAADPGPELPIEDLQRGVVVVVPPPDPDAERVVALAAAADHLERLARRERRHNAGAANLDLQRALAEQRYCVIDTETTGMRDDGSDELLEIGAIRVVDGSLDREFTSLVRPVGPITSGAQAVHGIRAAAVAAAPPVGEILPYLIEMASDCVLVFHNAPFDLGFLQRALADADRPALAAPVVDTLVVARRLLGGRCGLGTLGTRLALEGPHLHRALPDARLTARLLIQLLAWLQAAGATSLSQVPGIALRPPRPRRRHAMRSDLLLQRLEQAKSRGEVVRIACRVGRGVAPIEVRVRFLHVAPDACIAFDVEAGRQCALDPASIVHLEPAP